MLADLHEVMLEIQSRYPTEEARKGSIGLLWPTLMKFSSKHGVMAKEPDHSN